MAVKRGTRTVSGDVSMLPVLAAIASGKVDAALALKAWERRDYEPIPEALQPGQVAKERPNDPPTTLADL